MAMFPVRKGGKLTTYMNLSRFSVSNAASLNEDEDYERMPFLPQPKRPVRTKRSGIFRNVMPPRYLQMATNQNWNDVWPAAKSFNPTTVPLPVFMGNLRGQPRLGKFNNPELVKIPNFFHLVPPNIKKQCRALKKFCSSWPEGLETDEKIEKHFPVEIVSRDYCHASPTVRDPRARKINITFKLSRLELDDHSRDKIIRLLDKRYDPASDLVTIETSSCPCKKQNIDYAFYLLTVVYYESWKTESWEELKEPQDWERFFFEKSASQKKILDLLKALDINAETKKEDIKEYEEAIKDIMDNQENDETVDAYGRSVAKLLFSQVK